MISATNDKKDDRSSEDDENKIMRKGVKIMDKLEKVEKLREKTGVSTICWMRSFIWRSWTR